VRERGAAQATLQGGEGGAHSRAARAHEPSRTRIHAIPT
jgi:hypothetical protein